MSSWPSRSRTLPKGTRPDFRRQDFDADAAGAEFVDAGLVVGDGEDGDIALGGVDELAVERHAQGGVEDEALEGAAAAETAAVGEHGVVGEDGVDADQDGVGLPAERLDGGAGGFAGDPIGLADLVEAGRRRDAAVEGHGDLHEDEGAAGAGSSGRRAR